MTDQDRLAADRLLARIEMLVGEFPHRDHPYAQLISGILEATNGLRSVLQAERAH